MEGAAAALAMVRRHDRGSSARLEDETLVTASPTGRGRDLVPFLVQSGSWPDEVAERQQNLEEIVLSLTGGVN